jgi:ribosomal protein S18 acetylase RimI-like enzyme
MIRPAGPADVPTILRLIQALADYERATDEVRATEAQLHDALFGRDAVASCLLAVESPGPGAALDAVGNTATAGNTAEATAGNVVGFALWFRTFSTWLGRSSIYLEDLFVLPEARGGGYGRALLTELAAIAVERGYGRVEWSVLNWNEPAQGFYRRLGAAPQDEWTVWRLTGQGLGALGSGDPAAR